MTVQRLKHVALYKLAKSLSNVNKICGEGNKTPSFLIEYMFHLHSGLQRYGTPRSYAKKTHHLCDNLKLHMQNDG